MSNFSDMLSQAKNIQEKMKEVQENLKKIEVEGVSGGELVKVVLKGDYEMKSIFVHDNAKNEKKEIIYDLIVAAYNDAKDKLKKKTSSEISKVDEIKNKINNLKELETIKDEELKTILSRLPNIADKTVPIGINEADNTKSVSYTHLTLPTIYSV